MLCSSKTLHPKSGAGSGDASLLVSRQAAFHMATRLYANWMTRGTSFAASDLSRSSKQLSSAEFSWSTRTENPLAKLQQILMLTAYPRPVEVNGMRRPSMGTAADVTAFFRTNLTEGS